ncbi:hypothetical protein KAT08_00385 [Candidatus Babeliales bacterium]|nr:hypothetical protein [Candidatus Babeliales bacterium]
MNKQKLILILIFITSFYKCKIFCNTDAFSKIVITSNKAICQKDKSRENIFTFSYLENVFVKFANKSTIQSDELEIELDTTQIKEKLAYKQTNINQAKQAKKVITQKTTPKDLSQFKKITFKNNVVAKQKNRIVHAEKAELFLSEKICKLLGNVKINQTKEKPKDLPVYTECNQVILNLATEQVTFLGSSKNPVSTTIKLEGHPSFTKKPKTRKERKTEKKALKRKRKMERKNSRKRK